MRDPLQRTDPLRQLAALLALGAGSGCFSPTDQPLPAEDTEEPTGTGASDGLDDMSVDDGSTDPDDPGDPGPNERPVARPDGPYLAPADVVLEVDAAQGVLSNDEDADADPLTIEAGELRTEHDGVVRMRGNGSFDYEPSPTLPYGTDSFEYTVVDEHGARASARVRVVVEPTGGVVNLGALGPRGRIVSGIVADHDVGGDIAGVGDINGDGFDDLLVTSAEPASHLIYGGPGTFEPGTARGHALGIDQADVHFVGGEGSRHTVAAAGDVDGDGFADLLIGNYEAADETGRVYLIYGGADFPQTYHLDSAPVVLRGIAPGDRAGYSMAGAGDIDGDGFDDILVGAPRANPALMDRAGEVYMVRGGPDLLGELELAAADARLTGHAELDEAGISVAMAGDVDGDGFDDILVGAWLADPGGRTNAGEAYLVLGGEGLVGTQSLSAAQTRFAGVMGNDRAGISVSGAGDFNGDGLADVLIGAHQSVTHRPGEAALSLGSRDPAPQIDLPDAELHIIGLAPSDRLGTSVSGVGDFDGDGFDDILVGAHAADPADDNATGEAYLLLGRADLAGHSGLANSALRLQGPVATGHAGRVVAAAGDVDGDGFADLMIGAEQVDLGEVHSAGQVYVVRGDDLRARVTMLGHSGTDTLIATGGFVSDALVAGRGDDTLLSDGGLDVLLGGQGDDTLTLANDRFFRIDGGHGHDTLTLVANVELDLSDPADRRVLGIERVMLAPGGASALRLSDLQARRLAPGVAVLVVDGDDDDELWLEGSWTGPTPNGQYSEYVSTPTGARLAVDPRVDVFLR